MIRLDETVARANLSMVSKSIDEMMARRARLEAERDGVRRSEPGDLSARSEDFEVGDSRAGRKLFDSRREARAGQKSQLQAVAQLAEQIDGTKLQAPRRTRST